MNSNNIIFFKNYKLLNELELNSLIKNCNHFELAKCFNLGIERLEILRKSVEMGLAFELFLTEHIKHVKVDEDIISYSLKYVDIDKLISIINEGVNYNTYSENFIEKLKLVNKLSK